MKMMVGDKDNDQDHFFVVPRKLGYWNPQQCSLFELSCSCVQEHDHATRRITYLMVVTLWQCPMPILLVTFSLDEIV